MGPLLVAAIPIVAFLVPIIADLGMQLYGIYQNQQDINNLGEVLTEAFQGTLEDIENALLLIKDALKDVVSAIYDAVLAILQYLDAWGLILLSGVIILGVMMLMLLYLQIPPKRRN